MSLRASVILGIGAFLATLCIEVMLNKPAADRGEVTSEAMGALDMWTISRAYPDVDIPPDRYYRAYLDARGMKRESDEPGLAPAPWESIGPINF